MTPKVYSVTGVGVSPTYPTDNGPTPFNVALSVRVSGTITYTVQYTFDDVFVQGWDPATGNWTDHPSLTSQTTTKDSNIAYPVTAIRLKTTAGSGTAVLTIIQAG